MAKSLAAQSRARDRLAHRIRTGVGKLRRPAIIAVAVGALAVPFTSVSAAATTPNFLTAGGFESDPWAYFKPLSPDQNWYRYCNGAGFYTQCFVEFNGGRADQASIYQDAPMPVTSSTNVVADAVVRCPANQGDCVAVLAVWGDPGSPGQESRAVRCNLPANGRWYHLRLDGADGVLGNSDPTFDSPHSVVRWELYDRTPGSNLDVDDAYLTDASRGSYFVILGDEGICDAVPDLPIDYN
jgi:hypothetical protein